MVTQGQLVADACSKTIMCREKSPKIITNPKKNAKKRIEDLRIE